MRLDCCRLPTSSMPHRACDADQAVHERDRAAWRLGQVIVAKGARAGRLLEAVASQWRLIQDPSALGCDISKRRTLSPAIKKLEASRHRRPTGLSGWRSS